ncbi:hypothetical protein ACE1TF_15235 [Geomicrobium sp. JSM 1781026]|uniref:hypothetical protein n=1 Tax=Geomicrobium sp. JSM 1781026 TaxID=3344580 RepID=UPI0035C166BC
MIGFLIGVKKKLHLLSFIWVGFSEDLVTSSRDRVAKTIGPMLIVVGVVLLLGPLLEGLIGETWTAIVSVVIIVGSLIATGVMVFKMESGDN